MTIYYVKNGGNDSADGLSDANAWATISKVNGRTFSAGDSILFKRGSTWREKLTVPSSGSSGNQILFGAYDSGNKPIISAADLISGFDLYSSGGGSTNFGDESADANSSWGGDYLYFVKVSITSGGTISQHKVYFGANVPAKLKCALYTDDGTGENPSTLVANSTSAEVAPSANAWATLTVTGGATISSGTYWLASWMDTSQGTGWYTRAQTESSGTYRTYRALTYTGTFPSSAGTTGYEQISNYDQYITITTSGLNVYRASVSTQPTSVYIDGNKGALKGSAGACTAQYDWFWGSSYLYLAAASDPGTLYTSPGVEAANRTECVYNSAKNYITLQNLDLRQGNGGSSNGNNIRMINCTGFLIDACDISRSYYSGIRTETDGVAGTIQNCYFTKNERYGISQWATTPGVLIVDSNTWYDNGSPTTTCALVGNFPNGEIKNNTISYQTDDGGDQSHGIYVDQGSTSCLIEKNTVHHCVGNGIYCKGSGVIRYNHCYNCYFAGVSITDNGTANVTWNVYYNLLHNNKWGITSFNGGSGTRTATIYNNTLYHNDDNTRTSTPYELGFENTMASLTIKNNIIVSSGTYYCFYSNQSAANLNATIDYNLMYGISNVAYISSANKTWAQWQALGFDAHGKNQDPLFVTAGSDFHLQSGSPCINAGVDVGLTVDYLGHTLLATPDIGVYEYISEALSPGSYAITGTAAGLYHGYYLSAASGSYGIAATNVTLLRSRVVVASPDSYIVTGTAANTLYKRIMAAATEAYALTGTDASVLYGRLVGASPGAMTITGTAASLLATRLLSPDPGSYDVTGTDVGTYYGRLVLASPDSYVITPVAVDLIYAPGGNPLAYTLTADPGSYAFTAPNAGVFFGRVLTGSVGSYDLTGADIAALKTWLLHASPDSYVMTGTGVRLIYSGVSSILGEKLSIEIDIAI